MKNLAITAKLTGHPEPGLATKRRLRAIHFPVVRHSADVVRIGLGPRQHQTAPTMRQFAISVADRGGMRISFGDGGSSPALVLMEQAVQTLKLDDGAYLVGDIILSDSGVQTVAFMPSAFAPEVNLTEAAQQVASLAPSEFGPEVRLLDVGVQTFTMNVEGEHAPLLTLSDIAVQTLKFEEGDFVPLVSLGDIAAQTLTTGDGDYFLTFAPLTAYGDYFTTYPDGAAGTLNGGTQFSGPWILYVVPQVGDFFETYADGAATSGMNGGNELSGDWLFNVITPTDSYDYFDGYPDGGPFINGWGGGQGWSGSWNYSL